MIFTLRIDLSNSYPNLEPCRYSQIFSLRKSACLTTLRTKLTDAEILKATLRDLGICVKTVATVRGSGCQRVRADIVAILEGEYDMGWSRNADGSFDQIIRNS